MVKYNLEVEYFALIISYRLATIDILLVPAHLDQIIELDQISRRVSRHSTQQASCNKLCERALSHSTQHKLSGRESCISAWSDNETLGVSNAAIRMANVTLDAFLATAVRRPASATGVLSDQLELLYRSGVPRRAAPLVAGAGGEDDIGHQRGDRRRVRDNGTHLLVHRG